MCSEESFCGGVATRYEFPDYHLVKIALEEEAVSFLEEPENCRWWDFKGRKRRAKHKHAQAQLLEEIFRFWGDAEHTFCVCAPPITYFEKWGFTDYRDHKWVEYLMRRATHHHYVVLGYAPCLNELLPRVARRMKSLSIYLRERELTAEAEGLLEDLFEEYGVAADIHLLDDRNAYRKLSAVSLFPCNVLDFSKEERISPFVAPVGSIWLDFDGTVEKWHRIEGRNSKIHYFSLIKEWENPQNMEKNAL